MGSTDVLRGLTGRIGQTALATALVLLAQLGPSSWTASAATVTIPPGTIVFSHEESGSTVAAQQYSNLYTLDPQTGATARLTTYNFPVLATMPSWSRDFKRLTFSSNLSGVDSQEAASVFAMDASGRDLHEVSGPGIITPLPLGTATVTGRVDAPPEAAGQGTIVSCSITAEGAPANPVDCGNDAGPGRPFTLTHVPDGSQWIRVQAFVSYAGTLGSPGTSVAFATICVPCGQLNVGTVYPAPTQTLSVLPGWSGDGSQLVMTHIVEGKVFSGGVWKSTAVGDVTEWGQSGNFVREILSPPGVPAGAQIGGADWSPVSNRLCFSVNDAASATDSWLYLADSTGANATPIYKVPDITPANPLPLSVVTSCRWSPKGDEIAFVEVHENSFGVFWSDLYVIDATTSAVHPLTNCAPPATLFCSAPAWSPDESVVAFQGSTGSGVDLSPPPGSDLYVVDAAATAITRLTTDGRSSYPTWGVAPALRTFLPAVPAVPGITINRTVAPAVPIVPGGRRHGANSATSPQLGSGALRPVPTIGSTALGPSSTAKEGERDEAILQGLVQLASLLIGR